MDIELVDKNIMMASLEESYKQSHKRESTHVSDLILCTRQSILTREYSPDWNVDTLIKFEFGRAFETALAEKFFPFNYHVTNVKRELKVVSEGIVGHVDFACDPIDYECKLTFGKKLTDMEQFQTKHFYWFQQMQAYCHMRHRSEMGLLVCYMSTANYMVDFDIVEYRVKFSSREIDTNWKRLLREKQSFQSALDNFLYPPKTIHTFCCRGCPVKEVCDEIG